MHALCKTALMIALLGLAGCTHSRADRGDAPASGPSASSDKGVASIVKLPPPFKTGQVSLEEALGKRRSAREFAEVALDDTQHGQLLWAAQGITHRTLGLRTAPSAGALYPLEIYLVTEQGVFEYEPRAHRLARTIASDVRKALSDAALEQDAVREAPTILVIAGVYERTARKYGQDRAERYVHMEAGHAAQNVLLQAFALGLVAVPIGAFEDDQLSRVLELPKTHRPLYLLPVGRPAR